MGGFTAYIHAGTLCFTGGFTTYAHATHASWIISLPMPKQHILPHGWFHYQHPCRHMCFTGGFTTYLHAGHYASWMISLLTSKQHILPHGWFHYLRPSSTLCLHGCRHAMRHIDNNIIYVPWGMKHMSTSLTVHNLFSLWTVKLVSRYSARNYLIHVSNNVQLKSLTSLFTIRREFR